MSCRAALFVAIVAILSARRADAADRLCDASNTDCRAPLLALINNERVGIDVGFWFMEDSRIYSALINRFNAGVPVRIIMDSRANANYPLNVTTLAALKTAGIPMREKYTSGIVHWKTMIFAGQHVVEFSGANFTPHAFKPLTSYVDYHDEVIVTTDDPALVNSFKTKFDDVWTTTAGYRTYANPPPALVRKYPMATIDSRLNFPPYNNFATRSVGLYTKETVGIDALIFRITDRRHSDAMIAARQRGVLVRIITEQHEYRDKERLWDSWNVDRMYMAGVKIRVRNHTGWMHQKTTILRGQQTTIFGSSNWTSPSASSQLEHNLFTKNLTMFHFMSDLFARKWGNLAGITETKAFTPLPPDLPSYVAPVAGATGQPLTVTLKWKAGYWAHNYDIYFGTSSTPPRIAANVNLGPSTSSTDYRKYTITNLKPGTTYYWKIVSKTMANKTATGKVVSFRTQ